MKILYEKLDTTFKVYEYILKELFKDDWDKMVTDPGYGYVNCYIEYLLNNKFKELLDALSSKYNCKESWIVYETSNKMIIKCKFDENTKPDFIENRIHDYIYKYFNIEDINSISLNFLRNGLFEVVLKDRKLDELYFKIGDKKIKELDNMKKPKDVDQELWDDAMSEVRNDL